MENQDQKIQEMQMLEQNLQNLLMQKQAFGMELSETTSALSEVEKSGEEVYKIVGQLMIKSDQKKIIDELQNKKKILELRESTFDKQEKAMSEQVHALREEIMNSMKKE